MGKRKVEERPYLQCYHCGDDLFPADGRGRHDEDGNYIGHRDECRCRWCGWLWWETEATCKCGTRCIVDVDDCTAYVRPVEP